MGQDCNNSCREKLKDKIYAAKNVFAFLKVLPQAQQPDIFVFLIS